MHVLRADISVHLRNFHHRLPQNANNHLDPYVQVGLADLFDIPNKLIFEKYLPHRVPHRLLIVSSDDESSSSTGARRSMPCKG